MIKTRAISRAIFIVVAVFLLVYINRKSNENAETIVEFKLKTLQKIQTDTLDAKQKINLLANETTKFVNESSRISNGIHYFTVLFVLGFFTEFIFYIRSKQNMRRHDTE